MESIGEILQGLARQRGRNEHSPLLLWHTIAATEGARVSHVPISQHLSHAWIKLTGNPFRPHQSLALTTLRRGDAIALSGESAAGAATARLLLFEMLRANPGATALILVPELHMAREQVALLQPINQELGNRLTIATVGPTGSALHAARAHVILTTPEVLHNRLLRYHDRIWQQFWQKLRSIWLDQTHRYIGVAATHIGALLLRCSRLRAANQQLPQMIATLATVANAEETLNTIWGAPWRLIAVDDTPLPESALAVWRAGSERLRDSATIAQALERAGYSVHLNASNYDLQALRQFVGNDSEKISVSNVVQPAEVQIVVSHLGSSALRQAMASGAEASILVLGDQTPDTTVARLHATLMNEPNPHWPLPPANVFVTQQHLLCAANEQPLSGEEIEHWQMQSLLERMVQQKHIVRMPGDADLWQAYSLPLKEISSDPYAGFGLQATGGMPTQLITDQGRTIDQLDSAAFERWGYPGAVLPPGGSRYRVVNRDAEQGTLMLRPEVNNRRTFPLRRCHITLQDERDQANLRSGHSLGWGRVQAYEEIFAYRETKPSSQAIERPLAPVLTTNWSTHAVWVEVGVTPPKNGQMVGWSLAYALSLRVGCRFNDIVPAYDPETQRLYFIDTQPGGNGLATWIFANFEDLLPLAYDIALDCRNDALLEPTARADMDWLLLLLGKETQPLPRQSVQQPSRRNRTIEIEEEESELPEPVLVSAREAQQTTSQGRTPSKLPRVENRQSSTSSFKPDSDRTEAQSFLERQIASPIPSPSFKPEAEPKRSQAPAEPEDPLGFRAKGPSQPEEAPKRKSAPAEQEKPASFRSKAANTTEEAPRQANKASKKARGRRAEEDRAKQRTNGQAKAEPVAKQEPLPTAPTAPIDELLPPVPPKQPEPAEPPPSIRVDANAMIARMRELRQQREQEQIRAQPAAARRKHEPIEPRFHKGDLILCQPYGEGTVIESRIEDESELLDIEFPEYGTLTIDPIVSLVRLIQSAESDIDDDYPL
jgi:DEAD/DEAH box helicase domain-containing protein